MERERVLHIIGSFQQGGSEFQAVQLIKFLKEEGSVDLYVASLDNSGPLLAEFKLIGLPEIPEFPLTSFYDLNFVRKVRECVRFIKRNRISIVQTHDFYTNVFGMAASLAAAVPNRIAAKRETALRTPLQGFVERRAFNIATKIVANAEAVKEYLVSSGVKGSKVRTIYNGVDLERIKVPKRSRQEVFREFGVRCSDKSKVVTILANLRSRVKNHEMFLRSAGFVGRDVEDAVFVIAGEGTLVNEMKNLAGELGIGERSFFIGRCSKVGDLLSATDVGVLSSDTEGLPNSVLEYMSASLPVVATSVGGIPEIVSDGQTGYLVDAGDHVSMAEKITKLLKDEKMAREFGKLGHERIRSLLSLEAQLRKTLELYQ